MFAAGRKAAASSEAGAEGSDAAQAGNDWLSVGKSFPSGTSDDKSKSKHKETEASESVMQVYKHSKHRHKDKKRHKEKKRCDEESCDVAKREKRHLSKHKKKSKDRKRRRSWSRSDSSDGDDTHRSSRRRRRSRSNPRSRSRSRSQSRSDRDENRIVTQSDKTLTPHETEENEKLFEFDSVGDRENRFFGSTYAHDQPLYNLATRRNLLTGAWISQTRPKFSGDKMSGKREEKEKSDRYFSMQARKMEKDGRRRRLYLAYSEKRLSRAAATRQGDQGDQTSRTTRLAASCLPEMSFIPVDPILDINKFVANDIDEEPGHVTSTSDDTKEAMLTDGQSAEQHLVERSKLLNAAVAANPRDVDKWLDLIAFQDETLRLHSRGKNINSAMRASVAEKQAAILSKALTKNPHSRRLHRVKLNMTLQVQVNGEGAELDSFQRQLETLLSQDLTNSDLWIKLLQCRQQHFGSFSIQSVRDLYARILTVLRPEVEKEANTSTKTPSPTPGLDETPGEDSRAAKFLDPATMLLDFHLLMCVFEKKAGYVERSIAQTQALIDFNLNESAADKETGIHVNHLEMLREFGSRWNKDGSVGLGNEQWNTNAGVSWAFGLEPPELSGARFEDYIQTSCVTSLDRMNPPEAIRSQEHKQNLLSASADYQRKSKTSSRMEGGGSSENKRDSSTHSTGFVASDDSETDSRQSGRLIYSNLHGYRINIDDANDAEEYERILRELRGTESARARKDQLIEKEKAKREVLAAAKSQLEDQRADFPLINADDRFMKWLTREEVQSQLQWAPLRSSNPLHQELIERQPDRAILTDEIQPFLFGVPGSYRWRLIVQILHLCGVQWRGENQWGDSLQACQWMYADDAADCELLVNPILSAFNPRPDHSTKHKLFLDSLDRKALLETAVFDDVLVKEDVLRDPSKVAFIRRVFKESLSAFQNVDDKFGSILKCLWIGFEAEVTSATGADETFLMYARGLSQKLVQKSADHDTDFDVLFAYAKLEHKLGNERQVRRICDNTLASLRTPSSSNANLARSFHRFAFLRARIELWPSTEGRKKLTGTLTQDQGRLRVLRCLFTLWNALQPEQQKEKEKETLDVIAKLHRKRLRNYLEELLTSDPSTETDLITRYRAELRYAIWQCTESCPQSCGGHTSVKRSHYQSGCGAGYCLHNLALVVYAYQGFEAACQEYRQGLANAEHQACSHLKWMWTCFLGFMQQHQASGEFPAVAPRAWRSSIGKAVEIFPNEALFLRLFVDAETGNTISQVLRNYFLRVEKRWQRHYDSPELVEWLFSLLCEVCRVERAATIKYLPAQSDDDRLTCCLFHWWGMNNTAVTRIRQTFESMVNHIRTKGNALCWRLYMRFEIALGKVEAAKKVLYRGIAACAWSKALYMDGLRMLRAYLSEDECHEILELLEAKELNVRVDFE